MNQKVNTWLKIGAAIIVLALAGAAVWAFKGEEWWAKITGSNSNSNISSLRGALHVLPQKPSSQRSSTCKPTVECSAPTPIECVKNWLTKDSGCLSEKYLEEHFKNFRYDEENRIVMFDYVIDGNIVASNDQYGKSAWAGLNNQAPPPNRYQVWTYVGPLKEYVANVSQAEAQKQVGSNTVLKVFDDFSASPTDVSNDSIKYDADGLHWVNNNSPGCDDYYDVDAETGDLIKQKAMCAYKPVIYLYPEEKSDVTVRLDYKGKLTAEYPEYDESKKGWEVTAFPDGKLINHADNREYSYLFWEGAEEKNIDWDVSKGFVVKGGDTREFLQEKLSEIGLTPKEYNEFIVYWYPLMKNNPYNLISFAGEQYAETAPLTIIPKPDAVLRVFMIFKPLDEKVEVEPQVSQPFTRKGFTVVEWGGTSI